MTRFLVNRPHVNRIWDERLRALSEWEPQRNEAILPPWAEMDLPASEGEEPTTWPFVDIGIGD
jgi:hypothetical protein